MLQKKKVIRILYSRQDTSYFADVTAFHDLSLDETHNIQSNSYRIAKDWFVAIKLNLSKTVD